MYVLGTRSRDPELGGCGDTVMIFQSRDLVQWEERELLSRKGWNYYNTSLAKGENGYVLCLEVGYAPDAPVGKTFTCFFATSPDMKTWTFMDNKTAYPMDRYCGGPYMRFHNGYFYLFLVTCLPCARFTNYLCRTKDFDKWEVSPYNPILMPSEEDKMISPRAAELEGLEETIRTCFNINNSDIDFCEWQGKTYINYAVGNQLGYYHMCEAEYDGPVGEFLEAFFQ